MFSTRIAGTLLLLEINTICLVGYVPLVRMCNIDLLGVDVANGTNV